MWSEASRQAALEARKKSAGSGQKQAMASVLSRGYSSSLKTLSQGHPKSGPEPVHDALVHSHQIEQGMFGDVGSRILKK